MSVAFIVLIFKLLNYNVNTIVGHLAFVGEIVADGVFRAEGFNLNAVGCYVTFNQCFADEIGAFFGYGYASVPLSSV